MSSSTNTENNAAAAASSRTSSSSPEVPEDARPPPTNRPAARATRSRVGPNGESREDALNALVASVVPPTERRTRRNAVSGNALPANTIGLPARDIGRPSIVRTRPTTSGTRPGQRHPPRQPGQRVPSPSAQQLERGLRREREFEERDRQLQGRMALAEHRLARQRRICMSDADKLREEEDEEDKAELRELLGVRVEEETFEAMVAREMGWDNIR